MRKIGCVRARAEFLGNLCAKRKKFAWVSRADVNFDCIRLESKSCGEALRTRKDGRSSRATSVRSQSVARCTVQGRARRRAWGESTQTSLLSLISVIEFRTRVVFYTRCNIGQRFNVRCFFFYIFAQIRLGT